MYPVSPKPPSPPGCHITLCSMVGPCWLPILDTSVYTHQSQTPYLSLPPLLPSWQPQVPSLSLWVWFCFVNKFTCIISFWSPHIRDVIGYFSFSVWLTSLSMTLSRSVHVAANVSPSFRMFDYILHFISGQYINSMLHGIYFLHDICTDYIIYWKWGLWFLVTKPPVLSKISNTE